MHDNKRPFSDLLSDLASVVTDLYGENAAALDRLTRDVQDAPQVEPVAAPDAPTAPAPHPDKPARPALPPFTALWKTADEPIDWTEILSGAPAAQGDAEKQAVYAANAAAVLRGESAAYLTVLKTANPMADLMPYVATLDVSALNADDMRAVFSAREDLLADEPRPYLAGMALRIARDLFAVLPVTRVTVEGQHEGAALLQVDFQRQELHKVRFAFIDPATFVEECGGVFQ